MSDLNIDTCAACFVIALVRIVGYSLNEMINLKYWNFLFLLTAMIHVTAPFVNMRL